MLDFNPGRACFVGLHGAVHHVGVAKDITINGDDSRRKPLLSYKAHDSPSGVCQMAHEKFSNHKTSDKI